MTTSRASESEAPHNPARCGLEQGTAGGGPLPPHLATYAVLPTQKLGKTQGNVLFFYKGKMSEKTCEFEVR